MNEVVYIVRWNGPLDPGVEYLRSVMTEICHGLEELPDVKHIRVEQGWSELRWVPWWRRR